MVIYNRTITRQKLKPLYKCGIRKETSWGMVHTMKYIFIMNFWWFFPFPPFQTQDKNGFQQKLWQCFPNIQQSNLLFEKTVSFCRHLYKSFEQSTKILNQSYILPPTRSYATRIYFIFYVKLYRSIHIWLFFSRAWQE